MTCDECGKTGSRKWVRLDGKWYCDDCKTSPNRSRILDAQGRVRDREWLNNKLDYTRTEKKWHDDIKARRTMPDGSVGRFKRDSKGNLIRYG